MKVQIICALALVYFMPFLAIAQPTNYVKLGVNYSYLRTEGGQSKPGLAVGIGKEFNSKQSPTPNAYLGISLNYVTKRLRLENKTWPASFNSESSNASIGDIPLDRSYLEFNANLGGRFSLSNKTAIGLFLGPMLSVPIKYLSLFRGNTIFLEPKEKENFKFDYLRCESEGADNYLNWLFGIIIYYRSYGIGIHYDRALKRQKCIRGLTIYDALDSFYVLMHFAF